MVLPSYNLNHLYRYIHKASCMKKILPALLLFMLYIYSDCYGQNRSIIFIEKPWSELLTMANDQKKLIFMDAYTSWCGPCKWIAANMFTKDSVADYYNKTFICAHFDMEKGEGLELAGMFQVKGYPSLLFINPSGKLVHKRVGAPQKIQDYLEMGKNALTPGEGLSDCMKSYQEGNRNPKFIRKYIDRLQGAYMPFNEPLVQYFETQKESDLLNRTNWEMMFQYLSDTESREFGYLLKHQKDFERLYTRDSVNSKIFSTYLQMLVAISRNRSFSEENYNQLKQKIRDSGYSGAEKVIFTADLSIYGSDKFFDIACSGIDKWYSDDYDMLNRIATAFLKNTEEVKYLEKAAGWAKKSIAMKSKADNNDTYANLMFKLGNKKEAIEYETKAIDLARKDKASTKELEASLRKFQE